MTSVASPVPRSGTSREPLGWAGTGDWQRESAAGKSAEMTRSRQNGAERQRKVSKDPVEPRGAEAGLRAKGGTGQCYSAVGGARC